jgi:hypothetical protein
MPARIGEFSTKNELRTFPQAHAGQPLRHKIFEKRVKPADAVKRSNTKVVFF